MFTKHISHEKKALSLVFMACLIAGAMIFAGCGQTVGYDADPVLQNETSRTLAGITANPPSALDGEWRDVYNPGDGSYDGYIFAINGTTGDVTYTLADLSGGQPNDYGLSFTADIIFTEYATTTNVNDSGVMVIKFISAPYDANADEFSAIYFRNLTATTVELANANAPLDPEDEDSLHGTATETTLAAALANFTWNNVDDYVVSALWIEYDLYP
jgi:hypothetical protein